MARIGIVTDSTTDLPQELLSTHHVAVIPHLLTIGGRSYRDQVDLATEQFQEILASSSDVPETSHPSVTDFARTFRDLADNHDAILAVLVSSKLSGSVDAATAAAASISDDVPVEVVDSLNVSLGLGFQVLRAAELSASGLELSEIALRLRANVTAFHLAFFVDTLDHLRRGGKVGTAATLAGTLLKLKPVLHVDEGQIVPLERTRTRARALAALDHFARDWPNINRLGVLYSSNRGYADELVDRLAVDLPADRIVISQIGPVLSAHVGPDAVGVCIDEAELP
jgi:DegV family protein with EDD domain